MDQFHQRTRSRCLRGTVFACHLSSAHCFEGATSMTKASMAALLVVATFSPLSSAQDFVKCTKRGATPVFTQEACPAGYIAAKAITYTPDPYARPYRPNVNSRPYAQRGGQGQGATVTVQRNVSACEGARAQRDAVLGTNNQGGNVDSRRWLNDQVAKHCY